MKLEEDKAKLLGSLLLFTRVFYQLRTGREFTVVIPPLRESHVITICRELVKCHRLETSRLIINIPPGLFKSTLVKYFIAWCFAHNPDSQFLYISYSHELAKEHTYDIKGIMSLKEYKDIFGIEIKSDSSAKDNFKTTAGGAVKAFGSAGAVTGQDGGLPLIDRFSGAVIMDDMHKPDEVHSDTRRENVIRNYNETIKQRPRSPKVPLIYIGQRLHEDDICAYLLAGNDGYKWKDVILKAKDDAGNSIHPIIYPLSKIETELKFNEYMAAAQLQQNPNPSGGGIFKTKYFVKTEVDPEILCSFIVVDTAETEKTYNDATAMSFFGIYKIKEEGTNVDLDEFGLHCINCWEEWVEPKDLKQLFLDFYTDCMRYKVKPTVAAIEKKSTGSSLLSYLSEMRGIQIIDIKRDEIGKSKTQRFIDVQPYMARKLISFPENGKHTPKCIEHLGKITANNSHRRDDIADTFSDAIKLALIDRCIMTSGVHDENSKKILSQLASSNQRYKDSRRQLYGSYS